MAFGNAGFVVKNGTSQQQKVDLIVMQKIIVEITTSLIEEAFKTGYSMEKMVVSKGLPTDAKLKEVRVNIRGNIEFTFISEKTNGEEKKIAIEVTTLRDA